MNVTESKCRTALLTSMMTVACIVISGCATFGESDSEGAVNITGSSTIQPIATIASRDSRIDTSIEGVGTNEGFERFCAGDADINNASVPIPGADGVEDFRHQCAENDVDYIELPIALDAVAIIRHQSNSVVTDLTSEELALIWQPDSPVQTWADVRDEWPDEEIVLYGRDEASGTFVTFTEEILGEAGAIRDDYEYTNDLDDLAKWVAEEPNALAFMGIGNYLSATEVDRNRITTITVDGLAPDAVNAANGDYVLARELYVYVSTTAIEENEAVEEYVQYLLENGRSIVPRAFFYPLDETRYEESLERLNDRTTGTDA